MKKEARLLREKAINSLILSIEHFNRPWDRGRVEGVLILLDHSFEMLLKAAILHRGGRIRESRAKETIGFDKCVRVARRHHRRLRSRRKALNLGVETRKDQSPIRFDAGRLDETELPPIEIVSVTIGVGHSNKARP